MKLRQNWHCAGLLALALNRSFLYGLLFFCVSNKKALSGRTLLHTDIRAQSMLLNAFAYKRISQYTFCGSYMASGCMITCLMLSTEFLNY